VILFVARSLATSVEVFLHDSRTFGERYFGLQAAAAMLIIFLFPAFSPREDPTPLYLFLGAYLVMWAAARSAAVKRRAKGELGEHSYYTGRPRLMGKSRETTVKGVIEPLVVWITGAFCLEFSPLLGGYLIVAGVGLLISVQTTLATERRRLLDMHDAYMEQRRVAEEWRRMRRD
jgi:hypothetical protein